ncbi:MAG: S9 family peptidase, partial [Holophagales bacterium]|nr:S9 family peptidase [Holophagales bacterium]
MTFLTRSSVRGFHVQRGLSRLLPATLVAFAILGCGASNEAPSRERVVYSAAAFHNTTSYGGASFSADESRLLISSDVSGVWAVYSVPVAGGEPRQLTDSAGPVFAQSYFPNDDRFLYTGDEGGNELNHLYVGSDGAGDVPEGGVDLTPGDNVRASFAGWRSDGGAFFVQTNERTPFAMDLYRYKVPPPGTWDFERELVFENDGTFNLGAVSEDGRWLALDKLTSNYDSDVYAYDLMAGHLVHVTEHEGEVEHGSGGFTPDSAHLYYGTNEHSEFNQIWSYDLADGSRELVLAADWDVFGVSFSDTGRYRVSAINEDASTVVEVLDTETGAPVSLPDLPAGDIAQVGFSASDRLMAFYLSSDQSPSDLYVYDLDQGGEALRLTQSLNPEIDPDDLVTTEVIRYPSFDGLEIPAILWRPHGASADNPAPAMVWVHGGPGGQTRRTYRADIQHLVNQGYVVLGVNNRGSSGYGKTFFHMDDRKHGEVDLQDFVWARTWLDTQDWVDG